MVTEIVCKICFYNRVNYNIEFNIFKLESVSVAHTHTNAAPSTAVNLNKKQRDETISAKESPRLNKSITSVIVHLHELRTFSNAELYIQVTRDGSDVPDLL